MVLVQGRSVSDSEILYSTPGPNYARAVVKLGRCFSPMMFLCYSDGLFWEGGPVNHVDDGE